MVITHLLGKAVPTGRFACAWASEFPHFHKCAFSEDPGFEKDLKIISSMAIVGLLYAEAVDRSSLLSKRLDGSL